MAPQLILSSEIVARITADDALQPGQGRRRLPLAQARAGVVRVGTPPSMTTTPAEPVQDPDLEPIIRPSEEPTGPDSDPQTEPQPA